MVPRIFQIKVFEDGSVRIMARMVGLDSAAVQQDDVASIAWSRWNTADETTELDSGTLAVVDTIFDSLQTESWSKDATGYNFRWDAGPTLFPTPRTADAPDRVSIMVTLDDGSVLPLQLEAPVLRTSAG